MSETIIQSEPKRFQCRHILTNGLQCRAVCLRGEDFCYFHHTTRRPVANPTERKGRRSTFTLPLVEDRASIQLAIAQILCRIASNDLDPRRAGLLLYGLQIASINLPRLRPSTGRMEEELTVEEIIQHPDHGPIAPEQDFELLPSTGGKTLEQILKEDWAREEARELAEAGKRHRSPDYEDEPASFNLDTLHAVAETPGQKPLPVPGAPSSTDGFIVGQGRVQLPVFGAPSSTDGFIVGPGGVQLPVLGAPSSTDGFIVGQGGVQLPVLGAPSFRPHRKGGVSSEARPLSSPIHHNPVPHLRRGRIASKAGLAEGDRLPPPSTTIPQNKKGAA